MQVITDPNPFDGPVGFVIQVQGGKPPYDYDPAPSPPNPPGVQITPQNGTALVQLPIAAPPPRQTALGSVAARCASIRLPHPDASTAATRTWCES